MDQYDKKMAVRQHQNAKRRAVIEHEKSVDYFMLDRSHYARFELMARLAYVRREFMWRKLEPGTWVYRQQMWYWHVAYVQLRLCFNPPLPWEANRYCRWL